VPRKRKFKKAQPAQKRVAQLKVRLPEPLRHGLEQAAARNGHSMNVEAVKRLAESFHLPDQSELIVDMLLRNLDSAIVDRLVDKAIRDRTFDEREDLLTELERLRDEEAAAAGDAWQSMESDRRRNK
jgi:hypothetical protein